MSRLTIERARDLADMIRAKFDTPFGPMFGGPGSLTLKDEIDDFLAWTYDALVVTIEDDEILNLRAEVQDICDLALYVDGDPRTCARARARCCVIANALERSR